MEQRVVAPSMPLPVLALLAPLAFAPPVAGAPGHELPEVLVKLRAGVPEAVLAGLAAGDVRVSTRRRTLPSPRRDDRVGLARIHTLTVEPGTQAAVAALLRERPEVEWVEVNRGGGELATTTPPDDPLFPTQWALDQPSDVDVDMPEAWAFRGTTAVAPGLLVGLIDSGFPAGVADPDLVGVLWTNPLEPANGIDDDGNGFVDDVHGYDFFDGEADTDGSSSHGYLMTSVLSAQADNGAGIAGAAPGLQVVHARVFSAGNSFPTSGPWAGKVAGAAAFTYLTDLGVDLINNSWVDHTGPSQLLHDSITYATDNGVHVVFAVGNTNGPPEPPSDHPDVIAVAGIEATGFRSSFSNFGPEVDVAAGATGIACIDPVLGVVHVDGTSLGAPYVTAIAAYALSEAPDLSVRDLRALLMDACVDLSAIDPASAGTIGAGHVNALRTLERLAPVEDVGAQLAGDSAPVLNAWGTTLPGDPLTFSLSSAEPSTLGLFVVGASQLDLPLLSGTLVPTPDLLRLFGTNADGEHVKSGALPDGVGAGVSLWVQMLVADPGAPEDWSFSNAVRVTGV